MPLFAAYGLLTALMIAMALVATLLVLPSILIVITRDSAPQDLPGDAMLDLAELDSHRVEIFA